MILLMKGLDKNKQASVVDHWPNTLKELTELHTQFHAFL